MTDTHDFALAQPDPAQMPPDTFALSSRDTGVCYLPDVFAAYLPTALTALDNARVWNGHQNAKMVAQELDFAAQYFSAVARQCEARAADARLGEHR